MSTQNRSQLRDHIRSRLYDEVADTMVVTDGACRSCLNCTFFIEASETCQKYNARPPARVIAFACEGYSDIDEIPF